MRRRRTGHWFAAAILAAAAAVAAGEVTHRAWLKLGTQPTLADIAENGTVKPDWIVKLTQSYGGGDWATPFFAEVPFGDVTLHGVPTVESNDYSVATPSFDVTLGGEINNEPKRFTVFYHCRLPGEATISATLPIDDYIPLRWSWTKLCSNELASHVNVGTSSRSTDVVLEGVPAEAWNASLASASLGPMESRHEFFVSVTKGQAFYAVDVDVEPTLALVQVEGDFDPASGGEVPADLVHDTPVVHVPGNQEKVLRLSVSCQASGEAQVGVHLKPYALYDAFRPIMFGFRLRCGGVPRQRLLVATTVLREGINPLDANVASDGSLLVSWGELTYVADPQERIVVFKYALAPRQDEGGEYIHETQKMLAPELVVADEEVAEALVVDASGQPVQGNIEAAVSDSWRTVGVMLLCRSTVSAETSVTFTLRPGVFDPIEVRFRKQCGGYKRGFSIKLPLRYLDSADDESEETTTVLFDGKALSAWAPETHTAVVHSGAGSTPFSVVLGHALPGTSPQPNSTTSSGGGGGGGGGSSRRRLMGEMLRAGVGRGEEGAGSAVGDGSDNPAEGKLQSRSGFEQVQSIQVEHVDEDTADWLTVTVDNGTLGQSSSVPEGATHVLTIGYDCPSWGWFPSIFAPGWAGGDADIKVTIELVAFMPGEFAFTKHCDGWLQTPVGLTVFTLVVLALVGVVVYCCVVQKCWQRLQGYREVPQHAD